MKATQIVDLVEARESLYYTCLANRTLASHQQNLKEHTYLELMDSYRAYKNSQRNNIDPESVSLFLPLLAMLQIDDALRREGILFMNKYKVVREFENDEPRFQAVAFSYNVSAKGMVASAWTQELLMDLQDDEVIKIEDAMYKTENLVTPEFA